jgi:hypothetical protein
MDKSSKSGPDLTRDRAASTFIRLFTSTHVADLRLLFGIVLLLSAIFSPILAFQHAKGGENSLIGSPTLAAGMAAIALTALARIYQMGSVRLGIVDLFSCEIITICRVVAVVDFAHTLVAMYDDPPPVAKKFSSKENYSPIFNNNAKDLENLEARVVERVTEFYTYLKTMRDYLRGLADIDHPIDEQYAWKASVRNTTYMLFLMLESARNAIERLVEYEPEKALYRAEILLSEIVAYEFLLNRYKEDTKRDLEHDALFKRLNLRKGEYKPLVDHLIELVSKNIHNSPPEHNEHKTWVKVDALLNELNRHCAKLDGLTSVAPAREKARDLAA